MRQLGRHAALVELLHDVEQIQARAVDRAPQVVGMRQVPGLLFRDQRRVDVGDREAGADAIPDVVGALRQVERAGRKRIGDDDAADRVVAAERAGQHVTRRRRIARGRRRGRSRWRLDAAHGCRVGRRAAIASRRGRRRVERAVARAASERERDDQRRRRPESQTGDAGWAHAIPFSARRQRAWRFGVVPSRAARGALRHTIKTSPSTDAAP